MFKGNWRKHLALGITLFGLSYAALSVLAVCIYHADNTKSDQSETGKKAHPTTEFFHSVGENAGVFITINRPEKSETTTNTEEADKADGQSESNEIALASLLATIAGVIVAIGGTAFVAITLKHTELATIAALQGDRAWMIPTGVEFVVSDVNATVREVRARILWKNCGHSPATNVRAKYDQRFEVESENVPKFDLSAEEGFYHATIGQSEPFDTKAILINSNDTARIISGRDHYFIYGYVEYFDVFDPHRLRTSEACYWITHGIEEPFQASFHALPMGKQNHVT